MSVPWRACAALVLVASPLVAAAQTNRGSIAGRVTDPTGAAIPNAAVTARNTGTGVTARTVSTSAGDFSLPQLPLGAYDVSISAGSFQTSTQTGVVVTINTVSTLNVQLVAGDVSQTVTVTADAPQVETATSEIGTSVTTRQVESLPLSLGGVGAFRSPEAFVFLTPGATGPGSGGSSNGIYLQKISGSENFGNEDYLDGISAVRPDNGSTFDETAPSVEAIQEFRVITSTPAAQYGRTTGGVLSLAPSLARTNSMVARSIFFGIPRWTRTGGSTAVRARWRVPRTICQAALKRMPRRRTSRTTSAAR